MTSVKTRFIVSHDFNHAKLLSRIYLSLTPLSQEYLSQRPLWRTELLRRSTFREIMILIFSHLSLKIASCVLFKLASIKIYFANSFLMCLKFAILWMVFLTFSFCVPCSCSLVYQGNGNTLRKHIKSWNDKCFTSKGIADIY